MLAPTLAGHAGGPPLPDELAEQTLADAVAQAMDAAGFETAHIVGNSLGGYVALQLAARGRARSVLALAPAGGWTRGDSSELGTHAHFRRVIDAAPAAAPHADQLVASRQGRRVLTEFIAERYEHIPSELLVHQLLGVAGCGGATALADFGEAYGWSLPDDPPACPVRIVWGSEDRLLPWPDAAARYHAWLDGHADWVLLDGVGHCPQLDVPIETAELILEFTAAA